MTQNSIELTVCGNAVTGAPVGISIEWAVFDGVNYLHQSYTPLCDLSLSGRCRNSTSTWDLGAGLCNSVVIYSGTVQDQLTLSCGASEDPTSIDCGDLLCDTQYIFWVKAHGNNAFAGTDFNDNKGTVCRTAPCRPVGECTLTWGYWKTHGPAGCNPSGGANLWNVTSLTIGSSSLSDAQLCAILHNSPSACGKGGGANGGANATLILEHQLIAAQLNMANGSINCDFANTAIATANGLLSGNEFACVGASTALGQQMIDAAGTLGAYNNDLCACPSGVIRQINPEGVSEPSPSSWGKLKLLYR